MLYAERGLIDSHVHETAGMVWRLRTLSSKRHPDDDDLPPLECRSRRLRPVSFQNDSASGRVVYPDRRKLRKRTA